jgi:hypothetical protein
LPDRDRHSSRRALAGDSSTRASQRIGRTRIRLTERGGWVLVAIAAVLVLGVAAAVVSLSTHDNQPSTPSAADAATASGAPSSDASATTATGATTAAPTGTSKPAPGGVPNPNQPGCSSHPSACGYPDATNTGVPSGLALTVVSGDVELSTPGQVLEGKDIRGCVVVKAPHVTIRRSKVTCTFGYAIGSYPEEYSGGGLLIEDVEVDCANSPTTAIGYYGLIGRRLNLHGCENGFDIDNDVTVVDSYIHDMRPTEDGHTDGIQLAGGSNIVIRHNTIFNPGGTSAIISHPSANSNVTIEANLLGGGAYTLYCPRDSSTNFRVLNNRFSTIFSPKGGDFGPWEECEKVAENRGNVWDSTLAPVG